MYNITGTLIDAETNEPLVGAHVYVPNPADSNKVFIENGQTLGATTDENGRYSLNLPRVNYDDLVISYVGIKVFVDVPTLKTYPVFKVENKGTMLEETIIEGKRKTKDNGINWMLIGLVIFLLGVLLYLIYNSQNNGKSNPTFAQSR